MVKETAVITLSANKKITSLFLPKQRYYFLLTVPRFFTVKDDKNILFCQTFLLPAMWLRTFSGVLQYFCVQVKYDFFGYIVAVVANAFESSDNADEIKALYGSFGELL